MAKRKKKNVSKGRKRGSQNAQKSAREMQTPMSDREKTPDHASGSKSTDHGSSGHVNQKTRYKHQNKFNRSPTRVDDFAPGELNGIQIKLQNGL